MSIRRPSRRLLSCAYFLVASSLVAAPPETRPIEGVRANAPAVHALTNVRIVVGPGRTIEKGTLVTRDGVIVAVGAEVTPPADAKIEDLAGNTIYPGLIDAYGEVAAAPPIGGSGYWNSLITPELNLALQFKPDGGVHEKLRSQGIVCRLIAPNSGIIKGTSLLVMTGHEASDRAILKANVAQHVRLGVPRNRSRGGYPNSPMGAVALARQSLLDANWYRQAWAAYQANGALPRPERNDALAALDDYLDGRRLVIFDAANELYFLRADSFAREFSLLAIVHGSGQEYQRLEAIRATGRPVIVPVNFPSPPSVATPEAIHDVEIDELLHWDLAPENPARLDAAGVQIALTTDGLRDLNEFLGQVRTAVTRGLPADAALRALTTTPAELFGVADRLGSIAVGKSASFVVTNGDLFNKKTKVIATWIDGQRYDIEKSKPADVRGSWEVIATLADGTTQTLTIQIAGAAEKLTGSFQLPQPENKTTEVKVDKLVLRDRALSGILPGKEFKQTGAVPFSAVLLTPPSGNWTLSGKLAWPTGVTTGFQGTRSSMAKKDEKEPKDNKEEEGKEPKDLQASFAVNYPLGAFGRSEPPESSPHVIFKNATVWTCGPLGTLANASVLVSNGKIAAVGSDVAVPAGAVVIDATGKHLAPGIIDCHSHMATDGGVNEGTQAVTAEVRVGDFIDCNDINIYRQLAGGVTTANILHGSANPIGGQNQVVKLRWGALGDEMKFREAPPGIKFALGENVKRSSSSEQGPSRYPYSRMGVEQIIRDEFLASREYQRQWERWERQHDTLPPRRDLELEAIQEILQGQRWVHCHSYRQDEILALLRTCEEFGIRIATLQHILEGYKVADAIARHGAMGSSFSDWWAYKVEVYDAIPYNGAMMHHAGVVVSFNSDDQELARHLNHEAAKAVKYGQIPPEEALKFVTLNPARQLRIDQLVGSIEPGKHADLVVWSGPPLSLRARCEQTWVDGRKYFDISADRQQRDVARQMRTVLVQKVALSGQSSKAPEESSKPDEELWPREDVYCRARESR